MGKVPFEPRFEVVGGVEPGLARGRVSQAVTMARAEATRWSEGPAGLREDNGQPNCLDWMTGRGAGQEDREVTGARPGRASREL